MTKKDKLSLKHKIGCGLGDTGGCMTFALTKDSENSPILYRWEMNRFLYAF